MSSARQVCQVSSVVGFGAWAVGGWMWGGVDRREAVDAITEAIDQGMNLIDTAHDGVASTYTLPPPCPPCPAPALPPPPPRAVLPPMPPLPAVLTSKILSSRPEMAVQL